MRPSGCVAGLIISLGLLCGCSQQAAATEDLIHALSDAHSAIASSILAIELYDQQRTTRAVTETLLGDMAEQMVDAERALEPVSIASEQTQADRDAALAAVQAGVAAVLTSRDQLEQQGAVDNTAALESAGQQVDAVLSQLRGGQVKKIFGVALGILTAIGGFVDIGDLVTNAVVGSRFGLSLGWAVVVGVIG
ncbi:MAG TPA: hypothetical protein VFO20_13970, partial [Propionibacteriaceae bacterium]|nr:hypothetical protein [Propionibacteriaceae bacterium]